MAMANTRPNSLPYLRKSDPAMKESQGPILRHLNGKQPTLDDRHGSLGGGHYEPVKPYFFIQSWKSLNRRNWVDSPKRSLERRSSPLGTTTLRSVVTVSVPPGKIFSMVALSFSARAFRSSSPV